MLFFNTVLLMIKAPVIPYDKSVLPKCIERAHIASAM